MTLLGMIWLVIRAALRDAWVFMLALYASLRGVPLSWQRLVEAVGDACLVWEAAS